MGRCPGVVRSDQSYQARGNRANQSPTMGDKSMGAVEADAWDIEHLREIRHVQEPNP